MATSPLTLQGQCEHCSWPKIGRYVIHATPWCPRFPAIATVDWNAGRKHDESHDEIYCAAAHVSRPVEVGEYVLLLCEDEFVTWGKVISIDRVVRFRTAAEVGPDNGFCYKEEGWQPR